MFTISACIKFRFRFLFIYLFILFAIYFSISDAEIQTSLNALFKADIFFFFYIAQV